MPYSNTYNTSHGYQPIQYGHGDRHISSGIKNFLIHFDCSCAHWIFFSFFKLSGSSSSDVISKDISASQSDITSIIHQTNQSKYFFLFQRQLVFSFFLSKNGLN